MTYASPSAWTSPQSDLTDYIGFIDASLLPQQWWDEVDTSDGSRGRLYKSDDTEIPSNWVDFDPILQKGVIWFRWSGTLPSTADGIVPKVAPPKSSNPMYLPTDTFGSQAVWSDHEAVFHMNQDPSGSAPQMLDATGKGHDATTQGGMTSQQLVEGKVGYALQFDNSDDWATFSPMITIEGDDGFSIWINTDTSGNWNMFTGDISSDSWIGIYTTNNVISFETNASYRTYWNAQGLQTNQWGRVTVSQDSLDNVVIGVNGIMNEPQSLPNHSFDIEMFGNGYNSSFGNYGGMIGDFWTYKFFKSADRLTFEYQNQNDPAIFWGTWTYQGGAVGTNLAVADSRHLSRIDQSSLSVFYSLLAQETRHLHRSELTAIGIQYNLSAQGARHLYRADSAFLQVYYDLLVQDSYHATLADTTSLDLFYSLTAQDSRHPVRADIVSLGNTVILLAPQDSRHAHLVNQPQLSVFYNLEPIQARHNLRSDEVTLQVLYDLLAQDLRHIHRTGNTGLTLLYSLDSNSSRHSLRTSDLQLGGILYTLTIDDSSHAHFSDLVTMGFDGIASWGDSHVDKLYAIGAGSDKLYAVKTTNQKLYIITLNAKPLLD